MRTRRWAALLAVGGAVLGLGVPAGAPAGSTCATFAPELRDLTVNQGLSTYSALVQGKETLVRAYLGLPSCANITGGAAAEIDSATLKVTNAATGAVLTTQTTTPGTLGPAFPDVTTGGSPTSLDSPADPKFVVPGNVLAGPTARYTANFTLTLTYKSKANATATFSAPANVTFTTLTGSRTTLAKTVEKPTNKLRILALPLGETLPSSASDAYLAGLQAMSRYYPVPDGTGGSGVRIGSLTSTGGGIRYTVNGGPIPLTGVPSPAALTLTVGSGNLAAGTYAYRVSAVSSSGESIPASPEATITLAGAGGILVSWAAVNGATGYKVYGRTAGRELLLTPTALGQTATSFLDDGSVNPSGALPLFCGSTTNFAAIKSQEATALQSWNSTNSTFPADVAQGILPMDISKGAVEGTTCAEGMAAVNGSQSWVRASAFAAGTTGMESGHNWGDVPLGVARSDGAYHNINSTASYTAGDTNRAYDVTDRAFLPTNYNGFRFNAGWTAQNVLLDPGDWAYALCKLGGATNTECTTSGTVGTAAAALPTTSSLVNSFVLSGVTDGTHLVGLCPRVDVIPANGCVRESYTAATTPTVLDPSSPYHVVETSDAAGNNVVQDVKGIPVSVSVSEHDNGGTHEAADTAMTFSAAVPLAANAVHVEFRNGTTTIYRATLGSAPTAPQEVNSNPIVLFSRGTVHRIGSVRRDVVGTVRAPKTPHVHARVAAHASRALGLWPALAAAAPHGAVMTLFANPFVVTSTGDGGDADTGDGVCADLLGSCTLRAAIQQANATAGADVIQFAIAASGVQTIQPSSALPAVTGPVTIDGTTQPGYAGQPLIQLDGSNAGTSSGLTLAAGSGGSVVEGLDVANFDPTGNDQNAAIVVQSDGNTIQGNHLGTNPAGTAAAGNRQGLYVTGNGNVIGGTTAAARNVISGSTQFNGPGVWVSGQNNVIEGNYIGTDVTGAAAIPNSVAGILIDGSDNTIGGTTAGARNVISGNSNYAGVKFNGGTGNVVEGNYIGTDATGTQKLGNPEGIWLASGGNVIGGAATGAGNVISGNNSVGIELQPLGSIAQPTGNQILGNLIGTNASGSAALANSGTGIALSTGAVGNTIGSVGAGNVISGNGDRGILIRGDGTSNGLTLTSGNTIAGNYVGLDASGTSKIGNSSYGIEVQGAGANAISNNVISGNPDAIVIGGSGVTTAGQTITGNKIGTDATGTTLLGNAAGIVISNSSGNVIGGTNSGDGNIIAGQTGDMGVAVDPFGGTANGNAIRGNSIYSNATLGIDLAPLHQVNDNTTNPGTGANNLQNYPVLSSASSTATQLTVSGSLTSVPSTTFGLDFFDNAQCDSSQHGEGQRYLGSASVTTDSSGNKSFTLFAPAVAAGDAITATATDPSGNTSEFSACVTVTGTGAGGGGGGGDTAQSGSTLTVNTAGDHDDTVCGTSDCTLREAIDAANAAAKPVAIHFAIPSGPTVIQPTTALPEIGGGVTIDGTTQAGYNDHPIVVVDGSQVSGDGLTITGANSTVRGLVVDNFASGYGIVISGADATNDTVAGNYVGVDATGAAAAPNGRSGILVDGASNDRIGGTAAGDRNVVSGNVGHGIFLLGSTNVVVEGNYTGTNASGDAAIANGIDGIAVDGGGSNTVGGIADGAGNVASGNTNQGISLFGDVYPSTTGNTVAGNYAGLNAAGTAAIPNGTTEGDGGDGVRMLKAINTLVIANVISGNPHGVRINNAVSSGNTVQGNRIGTNSSGTAAIPNTVSGVLIENGASGNTVGGSSSGQGNVISGNAGQGILIHGASGNTVQGNDIGTAADGTTALANGGNGVQIGAFVQSGDKVTVDGADNTRVGGTTDTAANVIAHNGGAGIAVLGGTGNNLSRNSITANGGLGIDLQDDTGPGVTPNDAGDGDAGPNNLQNFPVIRSATTSSISGTLNSTASTQFTIDLFSNSACDSSGNGEGAQYLATTATTTNGSGNGTFNVVPTGLAPGAIVTAIATDPSGNTSEFSTCATLVAATTGTGTISSTDSDTVPGDLRADIFLQCPGQTPLAIVATAVPGSPDPSNANTADFAFEKTVGCTGGKYQAKVYDGFSSSPMGDVGSSTTNTPPSSPVASIAAPGTSANALEYDSITLSGAGWSYAAGGTLPGSALTWTASPAIFPQQTGNQVVLSPPPNGGWFVGVDPSIGTRQVTITLTVTASDGTATQTRTITLYRDDDHDGIPAVIEGSNTIPPQGCFATGHGTDLDHNPFNAGQDYDGDGIPNGDDLFNGTSPFTDPSGACVKQSVYQGNALFATVTLTVPPSSPTLSLSATTVPYRDLTQISGSTVHVSKIDGVDVPATLLPATSWKVVNGIGVATFDGAALANYLSSHGLVNEGVTITVTGSPAGSPPPWRFEVTSDLLVIKK
jgi:CSLREA domain-containing protein